MATPLVEYLFNEAASGTTPTTLHSTGSVSSCDLPITYGTGGAWTSIASGDALGIGAGQICDNAAIGNIAALGGSKVATVEFAQQIVTSGTGTFGVCGLGTAATAADTIGVDKSGATNNYRLFFHTAADGSQEPAATDIAPIVGLNVVQFVIDTAAANRVTGYLNGFVAVTSNTSITSNTTLTLGASPFETYCCDQSVWTGSGSVGYLAYQVLAYSGADCLSRALQLFADTDHSPKATGAQLRAASTNGGTNDASTGTTDHSISFTLTIGAASTNRKVQIPIAYMGVTTGVTAITFNGSATGVHLSAQQQSTFATLAGCDLYEILDADLPAAGIYTIAVTVDGAVGVACGSWTYLEGVAQSYATNIGLATGTGTSITATLGSSATAGSILTGQLLDVSFGDTPVSGANQLRLVSQATSSVIRQAVDSKFVPASGANSVTWSGLTNTTGKIAIVIEAPASSGSAGNVLTLVPRGSESAPPEEYRRRALLAPQGAVAGIAPLRMRRPVEIPWIDESAIRFRLAPQPVAVISAPLLGRRPLDESVATEEPIRYVDGSFVSPTNTPPLVLRQPVEVSATEGLPRRSQQPPTSAVAGVPLLPGRRTADIEADRERPSVRVQPPQPPLILLAPLVNDRSIELPAAEENARRPVNVPAPQSSNALPLTAPRRPVEDSSAEERAARALLPPQPVATLPAPLLIRRLGELPTIEEHGAPKVLPPPSAVAGVPPLPNRRPADAASDEERNLYKAQLPPTPAIASPPLPARRAAESSIVEEFVQRVRLIVSGAIAGIPPLFARVFREEPASDERPAKVAPAPQPVAAIAPPQAPRRVSDLGLDEERTRRGIFAPTSAVAGIPPLFGLRPLEWSATEERARAGILPPQAPTAAAAPLFGQRATDVAPIEERIQRAPLVVPPSAVAGVPPLLGERAVEFPQPEERAPLRWLPLASPVAIVVPLFARRAADVQQLEERSTQRIPLVTLPIANSPPLFARAAREDAIAEEAPKRFPLLVASPAPSLFTLFGRRRQQESEAAESTPRAPTPPLLSAIPSTPPLPSRRAVEEYPGVEWIFRSSRALVVSGFLPFAPAPITRWASVLDATGAYRWAPIKYVG